jgi:hypothetical protein
LLAIAMFLATSMLPAYAFHYGLSGGIDGSCDLSTGEDPDEGDLCAPGFPHRDHCCHAYAHFFGASAASAVAPYMRPVLLQTVTRRTCFHDISQSPPTPPPNAAFA